MKYINTITRTEFLIDKDNCQDVVAYRSMLVEEDKLINKENGNLKPDEAELVKPVLHILSMVSEYLKSNYPHVLQVEDDHPFFMARSEKHWIDWSTGEPVLVEFTEEQLKEKSSRAEQEKINVDAQEYLDKTDKYAVRFLETGKAMPDGMAESRQRARDAIK